MIISMENISKGFGADDVLRDISASVEEGDRIGLIGENGAGKTTLLNILCGTEAPDEGQVMRKEGLRIGYLRQNTGLQSKHTILEEMRDVFAEEISMQKEMDQLARAIAQADSSLQEYKRLSARYSHLQGLFESRGGYHIDVKINTVLNGMKFEQENRDKRIDLLSGGEKTRLAICKLLLEEPAFLVLDEPTNHLDFETLSWLEEYLSAYKGAILIVSHDRYFLDRMAEKVWEIENARMYFYPGNYTKYVKLKEERRARQQKEFEAQKEKMAQMEEFIAKNMVRATTSSRAKSRLKALGSMEPVEQVVMPAPPVKLRFTFDKIPVRDVLTVKKANITVGEGESKKVLLHDIGLEIKRGEKVALIGPNGVGKTTFLKALLKMIPCGGKVSWGENTVISYFDQENGTLDQNGTLLSEMQRFYPGLTDQTLRSALGAVRLTGDDAFKKVSALSGGECARLKFAVNMLKKGNVLILDEPTNHLDLSTQEALDRALAEFEGTILMVSHDRYLLNKVPDRIIEITREGISCYIGKFCDYLEKSGNNRNGTEGKEKTKKRKEDRDCSSKERRQKTAYLKNELAKTEEEIHREEQEILELESRLRKDEIAADFNQLNDICREIEAKQQNLTILMEKWENLSLENEKFLSNKETVSL